MKKIISITLALVMLLATFTACKTSKEENPGDTTINETTALPETTLSGEPVRIFTLKGPTGMGMANIMQSKEAGKSALNYEITLANAADEFTGDIVQGNFEIACVPTNLAAVLHAKTNGAVSVAAVNTLGVLYVLENGSSINSVSDLEGKTIYSSGQGAVPEYALNYILKAFDINCEVIYESDHDLVVTDLISKKADIAILPEPKVTAALKNAGAPEGLRIALDLNKLWDEACTKNNDSGSFYMGCIIVNKAWADKNPAELAAFMADYKQSVDFINSDTDAAAEVIAKMGIVPSAAIAKAALPNCNIVLIDGNEMKTGLSGFINVLYGFNPASVGGKIPGDDIYYNVK